MNAKEIIERAERIGRKIETMETELPQLKAEYEHIKPLADLYRSMGKEQLEGEQLSARISIAESRQPRTVRSADEWLDIFTKVYTGQRNKWLSSTEVAKIIIKNKMTRGRVTQGGVHNALNRLEKEGKIRREYGLYILKRPEETEE